METPNQKIQSGSTSRKPILVLLLICTGILSLAAYASYTRSEVEQVKSDPENLMDLRYAQNVLKNLEKQGNEANQDLKEQENFEHNYQQYVAEYDQALPDFNQNEFNFNPQTEPNVNQGLRAQEQAQLALKQKRYQMLLQAINQSTTINQDPKLKEKLQKEQKIALNQEPSNLSENPTKLSAKDYLRNQGYLSANHTYPQDRAAYFNRQDTLDSYDNLKRNRFRLNSQLEQQTNPYLIRQGSIIPCILLSGINSDLPGLVLAQVSQNVYDSTTGRYLLIPQGSKIIGQYASHVAMGQQRVMLAFNRLIFPNGSALDLGAMPGSGENGYAGFDAQVNNHFWKLFGNSILLGGVTAGVSISVDQNQNLNSNDTSVSGAISESLGQSVGNMITNVIEKNMNISPTLQVQPGYTFHVGLIQDLHLPSPYL